MKTKIITFLMILVLLLTNISIINAETTTKSSKKNDKKLLKDSQQKMSLKNNIFDFKMRFLKNIMISPALSACAVKDDEIVWSNAYGYSKLYSSKKAKIDDIYSIGSVSKTIMATAFMHAYERDMYDLDENINNYLPFNISHPDYPNVNITVRMLLSHRSSIDGVLISLKGFSKIIFETPPEEDELDEWIKERILPSGDEYSKDYWIDEKPGTKATYSSAAHVILVYLFKMITNISIESYCYEHIFEPLEMYNTSFHKKDAQQDRIVTPYITKFGIPIPIKIRDYKALAPIGGILTTTEDLSHFLIMHMNSGVYKNKRILKNDTIELMHNTIYTEGSFTMFKHWQRSYGLDLFEQNWFDEKTLGHSGMHPGFVCYMYMNESDKTGFIIFSNHFNIIGFFQPIRLLFMYEVYYKLGKLLMEKARGV